MRGRGCTVQCIHVHLCTCTCRSICTLYMYGRNREDRLIHVGGGEYEGGRKKKMHCTIIHVVRIG